MKLSGQIDEEVTRLNAVRNAAMKRIADLHREAERKAEVAREHMAEGKLECVICWKAAKTHAFIPCGHRELCANCVPKMLAEQGDSRRCPTCRQPFTDIKRIFIT
mmetsp:Transcript_3916/g.9878  ORF Transcript_3916/g.9878 Transcript_3916/m.9878 type:complete len:105 (-) Transcript_3916:117-431(-)